jgi:hypothetical protein
MAQILHRAEIPALTVGDLANLTTDLDEKLYALPEKTIPIGERIHPWELLHHEGYWLNRAAKHTARRRLLAEQIPDEDRRSPGQSSANLPRNQSYIYDTYLAPEPYVEYPLSDQAGVSHCKLILGLLETSVQEFTKRRQIRMTERLKLTMAKEYMRIGLWNDALNILRPLWPALTWRRNGWWQLMEEFGWDLRECALRVQDWETVLHVDWELMNHGRDAYPWEFPIFLMWTPAVFTVRMGWCYDLRKSLKDSPVVRPKPAAVLKGEDVVSCRKSLPRGRDDEN